VRRLDLSTFNMVGTTYLVYTIVCLSNDTSQFIRFDHVHPDIKTMQRLISIDVLLYFAPSASPSA